MKKYFRWFILGLCITFLATTLHRHWQGLGDITFHRGSGAFLIAALMMTLIAHISAGAIWWYVVKLFNKPLNLGQAIAIYLKTNLAKYIPGNIWHFYGRVEAIRKTGTDLPLATVIVLIEPLLMAIAAAMMGAIALSWSLGNPQGSVLPWINGISSAPSHSQYLILGAMAIGISLIAIHPRVLTGLLGVASKLKKKHQTSSDGSPSPSSAIVIKAYPLVPLIADGVYISMRTLGFIFVLLAIAPTFPIADHVPMIIAGYSTAWVLGLIVPGAPGGLGVFEATMMVLLGNTINGAILISAIAIFRLVNTLAELMGAALAVVMEKYWLTLAQPLDHFE